jgi:hypothetical protein
MTADPHATLTTAAFRQRLRNLLSHWAAPRASTPRLAGPPRRGPLVRRRRRRLADPPAPNLWTIDRDELRSALNDRGF